MVATGILFWNGLSRAYHILQNLRVEPIEAGQILERILIYALMLKHGLFSREEIFLDDLKNMFRALWKSLCCRTGKRALDIHERYRDEGERGIGTM